jgi:hypothetical protein
MKAADHKRDAENAIHRLRCLANAGDREAIAAIRDVALFAVCILDNLTDNHAGDPDIPEPMREAVAAAHALAKESPRWPVALDAVKEIREGTLARWHRLDVGSATGIRLSGKRGFHPHEQTGFALDVFRHLDAIRRNPEGHRHIADIHPELADVPGLPPQTWQNLAAMLPPLEKSSITAWADAGRELCREWCENDWSRFPWPDCAQVKAASLTDENGNETGFPSAVREKIRQGFEKLIP